MKGEVTTRSVWVPFKMIFKLFHLESYLGSSEETRSPNAGSENARGRTLHLASLGTQARTSPTRRAHGRPGDPLSSAFWVSPALLGPWAAQGEVSRRGAHTARPGPALPGSGVIFASSTFDHRDSSPRHSLHNTPGGRKFFPPFFFHPRSSAGARASAGLRAQTREAPAPVAATARAEPSVPGSGPHSQVLPGPEANRTRGTFTPPLRPTRHPKSPNLTRLLPAAAPLRPRPDAQRAQGRGWVQEG